MDKSKYAQPTYLDLYGEAFAAYAKLVLRTNDLMMDYTAAVAATMFQRAPDPQPASSANAAAPTIVLPSPIVVDPPTVVDSPSVTASPSAAASPNADESANAALAEEPRVSSSVVYEAFASIPAAAAPDVVLEPSAEASAQIPPRPKKRAGKARRRKK